MHVLGKHSNLMLEKLSIPKYYDIGSPIVTVFINEVQEKIIPSRPRGSYKCYEQRKIFVIEY